MIDLHVHLRGTLAPSKAKELAIKNSKSIHPNFIDAPRYGWHDFTSFLHAYDEITSVIVTASDLEEVAYEYLVNASGIGVTYVEFMLSPPDLMRNGVPFEDQLLALSSARVRAFEEFGIDCRLIATAVRHLGPEAALLAAKIAVNRRHNILVGFGLTGDERQFEVGLFSEAFKIARSEGLLATAHAGEYGEPDTIIEAVEKLGLSRVGHGIRAVESNSVLRQLSDERIPIELCLSSNLALGLYPSLAEHPIRILHTAGCILTLGTDDPTFFDTNLSQEYILATNAILSEKARIDIIQNSIKAAFCDASAKQRLLRISGIAPF